MISEEFCTLNEPPWNAPGLQVYRPMFSPPGRIVPPASMTPTIAYGPLMRLPPPPLPPRRIVAVQLQSPPPLGQELDYCGVFHFENPVETLPLREEQNTDPKAGTAKFEELAERNGIRIGRPEDREGQETMSSEADDLHSTDDKLTNFQKIARNKGIRIGGAKHQNTDDESDGKTQDEQDEALVRFQQRARERGIRISESSESGDSSVVCKSDEMGDEDCVDNISDMSDGLGNATRRTSGTTNPEAFRANSSLSGPTKQHTSSDFQGKATAVVDGKGCDRDDHDNFVEIARSCGIKVGNNDDGRTTPELESEPPQDADGKAELFKANLRSCGITVGADDDDVPISDSSSSYSMQNGFVDVQDVLTVPEVAPELAYFPYPVGYTEVPGHEASCFSSTVTECLPNFELGGRTSSCRGDQLTSTEASTVAFMKRASRHGIQVVRPVMADAGTQTFSEPQVFVECSAQTYAEDLGISYTNTAVQVDPVLKAFQEEFTLWKLDESGDAEDLSYKRLYLDECCESKALATRLENEMDVSVRTRRAHKQAMEETKKEVKELEGQVEKLKKEIKTVKKHKETEIKRLTKEKKQVEEECESLTKLVALKDVALDALKTLVGNQTTQIKELEAKVQQPGEVSPRELCIKCHHRQASNDSSLAGDSTTVGEQRNSPQVSPVPGSYAWKVCTSGSRQPSAESIAHPRQPSGMDAELTSISLTDDTRWNAEVKRSNDLPKTAGVSSSELSGSVGMSGQARRQQLPASYAPGQPPPIQQTDSDGTIKTPPGIGVLSEKGSLGNGSVLDVDGHGQSEDEAISAGSLSDDGASGGIGVPPGLKSQAQSSRKASPSEEKPSQAEAIGNQEAGFTGTSRFRHDNSEAPMPCSAAGTAPQPSLYLPGVNSQNLYKYMSKLISPQQIGDKEDAAADHHRAPRPPPGLNTIPVPKDIPTAAAQGGACEFGAFDKLMSALQKRFPEHTRTDLIAYLMKARAGCGPDGFKGKHISEVVDHLAHVISVETRDT